MFAAEKIYEDIAFPIPEPAIGKNVDPAQGDAGRRDHLGIRLIGCQIEKRPTDYGAPTLVRIFGEVNSMCFQKEPGCFEGNGPFLIEPRIDRPAPAALQAI